LPVEGSVKLVDWWRDLKAGLKDSLLPLQPDVLGPLDETAKVPLGLDVLADAEVAGALLEQRVDDPLGLGLFNSQGGCRNLLALLILSLGDRSTLIEVVTTRKLILGNLVSNLHIQSNINDPKKHLLNDI
jgi:hypothetical protein